VSAALELASWRALQAAESEPLVAALAAAPVTPALLARLRRRFPAELVLAAAALARARDKLAGRIDDAGRLVADPEGAEQASSTRAARHKAARFARAGIARVVDLCAGIGGDAIELARVTRVLAVDVQPARAWMAARNAGCRAIAADVRALALDPAVAFHLDPQRRDAATGRRAWRFEDYEPGPAYVRELVARCPTGAIKLGPGVALDALPAGEIELLSERGHLTQAVLWTGDLAHGGSRRATLLDVGLSIHGASEAAPIGPAGSHLLAPDPAVERAGLLGVLARELDASAIHAELGLLTRDSPVASPWVKCFEVQAALAWRVERIARWLADHDGGPVELRPRGVELDFARTTRALSGTGSTRHVVFVQRLGREVRAWITREVG